MRITIFSLLLALASTLTAQVGTHFSSRERGWVTLGIDGGMSYQSSDIRTTFNGRGGSLTLGKNLAYRPGGLLSFDIRGRGHFNRSYGRNDYASYGIKNNKALNGVNQSNINYLLDLSTPNDSSFAYTNYRASMGELGVEGVFTFNRFRERTGIVFSLFGGVGLDIYDVNIDQSANGQQYDYLSINASSGRANRLSQLAALRDGRYESDAEGFENTSLKAGIMPNMGVELGYQVAPRFVIGVGHKMTFSQTDLLDGQQWTDANQLTARNDLHHYTNLFLRWDLGRRRHKQMDPPVINIKQPDRSPYISDRSEYFVRATITNVSRSSDVRCTVNGRDTYFELRKEDFGSRVGLQQGRNEVRITASNPAGRDEETVIIVWEDRISPPPPPPPPPANAAPEVRITNPARSPMTTDRTEVRFEASTRYVSSRREVRLYINGSEETNFTFAEGVEANLRLREGRNIVRIDVQTPAGRASDEVTINVERTTPPPPPPPSGRKPAVNITQPRNGNTSTGEKNYEVRATVDNIDTRDDITVSVNGATTRDFSFAPSSRELVLRVDLRTGDNEVNIKARNRQGEDEATATIKKTGGIINPPPPPPARKPEVTIAEPVNGSNTTQSEVNLRVNFKNVAARNEVVMVLNGASYNDFDFNGSSQTASGKIRLREGENILTVRVTNAGGSNEATSRVRYTAAQKPEVTIAEPANGSNATQNLVNLRVNFKNVAARNEIVMVLNGATVNDFDFNVGTQSATGKIRLREGENILTVKATNAAGVGEATARVRYTVNKPKPEVRITAPSDNSETRLSDAELKATATNITDKNGIQVYHNGRTITGFNFDARTHEVSARLTLTDGENTIRVKATNDGGTDEATSKVRLIKNQAPKVSISAPADKSRVSIAKADLIAKAENVFDRKQLRITFNNTELSSFTLDRGGNISAPLTLKEGKNTITITATTPDGTATATSFVVLGIETPVAAAPTVLFTQPRRVGKVTVTEKAYIFKAEVKNVTARNQLKVTFNGAETPFDLDLKTGQVVFTTQLKEGKNAGKIVATTPGGTAQAEGTVIYNTKGSANLPEVAIQSASQPVVSPFEPDKGSSSVLATTKLVTEKGQIAIDLDGKSITNFDFNASAGTISFVVDLKRNATNKITIKVTTPAGTDSDSRNVKFE